MLKIKVCGMKFHENINALAALKPDYMGFIFYEKSKRFVGDSLDSFNFNEFPKSINTVGVFVNSPLDYVLLQKEKYNLDFIQLHGDESPNFCEKLKKKDAKIIKAFQISEKFNFSLCENYNNSCEYFLFDTQTVQYGGSGKKFDWKRLENYKNKKEFFLSGGISLKDAEEINKITDLNIHAIDINSKFEIEPALKNIDDLKDFFSKIKKQFKNID